MSINISVISYQYESNYIEINENQSLIIPLKIKDEYGNLYTPTILRWKLTDLDGNTINGREFTVSQTTVDKIILGYLDTAITNNIDKLLLSIAAGVTISGNNYQQNTQIEIKINNLTNNYPQLFESGISDTLDDPFRDLDSPFTELDETF